MTTTNHPSGLPEQEPTSPTVAVLCDGATWANTGAGWESPGHYCSWGGLRNLAAQRGGATLFDLADLPTGLTEVQKEAVRSIESKFLARGAISTEIRKTFPEAFADLVTVKWKSGDSDDVWAELLRVARMDGAHVVGTQSGVTYSGLAVAAHSDHIYIGCTSTGRAALALTPWVDLTITVTAPKPVDPTSGDPVVEASVVGVASRRVFFRAEDGKWATGRDCKFGIRTTESLADVKRLSAQTIAELMGGAS